MTKIALDLHGYLGERYKDIIVEESLIYNSNSSTKTIQKKQVVKDKFNLQNPININPENERMKHKYYGVAQESFGKSSKTLNQIRYSLNVFDEFTNHESFKTFNFKTAKEFKKSVLNTKSINTAYRILSNLKFLT